MEWTSDRADAVLASIVLGGRLVDNVVKIEAGSMIAEMRSVNRVATVRSHERDAVEEVATLSISAALVQTPVGLLEDLVKQISF